jgi:hypothetical protein
MMCAVWIPNMVSSLSEGEIQDQHQRSNHNILKLKSLHVLIFSRHS